MSAKEETRHVAGGAVGDFPVVHTFTTARGAVIGLGKLTHISASIRSLLMPTISHNSKCCSICTTQQSDSLGWKGAEAQNKSCLHTGWNTAPLFASNNSSHKMFPLPFTWSCVISKSKPRFFNSSVQLIEPSADGHYR